MAPHNEGYATLAIMWALAAVTLVFVALRVYTRLCIVRRFGSDDVAYIIAGTFLLLYTAFLQVSLNYGFGQSIEVLEVQDIATAIKWEMIGQTFAVLGMAISKASLGLFLLRLMVETWHRIAIWIMMGSLLADSMVTAIIFWAQCVPANAIYDPRWRTPDACTILITPFAIMLGVWCIVADFFFAIFPVFVIWSLNIKKKEKIIIAASMSLGVLAGVAGIIRTNEVAVGFTANYTQDTVPLILWSAVEMCVTMICIGIPILRPLYRHVRYGSWSSSSAEGSYQKNGEDSGGLYELSGKASGRKSTGNALTLGLYEPAIIDIHANSDNRSDEHIILTRDPHGYGVGRAMSPNKIYVQEDVEVQWHGK